MIFNSSFKKRFFSLHTCAAFAAMFFAAFIATPCFGVVDTKFFTYSCYIAFGYFCVWGYNLYVVVGSGIGCAVYCIDEFRTAVGVYSMVATVIGNKHLVEIVAFGYAYCYRQHDAIAERYNGRLHIVIGIMSLGYCIGTIK